MLLLSFAGWSDAGASATTAVRYLIDQLMSKKFATIDPEEFYDFYRQRPMVRLNDNKEREIHWPSYDFYHGPGIGVDKGLCARHRGRTTSALAHVHGNHAAFCARVPDRYGDHSWVPISMKFSILVQCRSRGFPRIRNWWSNSISCLRVIKGRPASSAYWPMLAAPRVWRT